MGELYCVGEYFGMYPWSSGWYELGGIIFAMAIGIWGTGAVLGWVIYIVDRRIKR